MQRSNTQSISNDDTNKNAIVSLSEMGYVKNHRRADSAYKRRKNILYPLQRTGNY